MKIKGAWTRGEWFPERNPPTFNPGANAYQRAIIQPKGGRIVPGFAFGETAEECTANAWLQAASKELVTASQAFMNNKPNAMELGHYAISKAMGHLENKKSENHG